MGRHVRLLWVKRIESMGIKHDDDYCCSAAAKSERMLLNGGSNIVASIVLVRHSGTSAGTASA
jgi:hypothetical protein